MLTSMGFGFTEAELKEHSLSMCISKPVRMSRLFNAITTAVVGEKFRSHRPEDRGTF